MKRNLRHERFAALMARPGMTAAAAYREVYPKASPATAATAGPELLRNPQVAALVGKAAARVVEKLDFTAERVMAELARLAMVDTSRAFDAKGKLLPIHEIPEDVRRAISGFEYDGELRKVRFWSKDNALGLLAKHHGLLREILEVKDVTETRDISDEEWEMLAKYRHEVRGGGE